MRRRTWVVYRKSRSFVLNRDQGVVQNLAVLPSKACNPPSATQRSECPGFPDLQYTREDLQWLLDKRNANVGVESVAAS
jgi:hypothetical protein